MIGDGAGGRELWVCRAPVSGSPVDFTGFYHYQVEPFDDDGYRYLRCDGTLLGTAPAVADFTYEVTPYCLDGANRGGQSFDGSRFYTVDDLDVLLTLDFTGDGVVDDADTAEVYRRLGL
jgi:hypothetical protein